MTGVNIFDGGGMWMMTVIGMVKRIVMIELVTMKDHAVVGVIGLDPKDVGPSSRQLHGS